MITLRQVRIYARATHARDCHGAVTVVVIVAVDNVGRAASAARRAPSGRVHDAPRTGAHGPVRPFQVARRRQRRGREKGGGAETEQVARRVRARQDEAVEAHVRRGGAVGINARAPRSGTTMPKLVRLEKVVKHPGAFRSYCQKKGYSSTAACARATMSSPSATAHRKKQAALALTFAKIRK